MREAAPAPAAPGPPGPGPGRPRLEVDGVRVENLAAILCTNEEIASVLGCSADTLTRNFADRLKNGRLRGKASLRRLQWAGARKGVPAMLIWLGKNYLGQSDKLALTGAGGGPIDIRNMTDDDLDRELQTAEREAADAATRAASAQRVN